VQEDFILVLDTDLYAGRYFIPELLEIVMADKDRSLIYGVRDQWAMRAYRPSLNLTISRYINCGSYVIRNNPAGKAFMRRARALLQENIERSPLTDQDAVNMAANLNPSVLYFLPNHFNCFRGWCTDKQLERQAVHHHKAGNNLRIMRANYSATCGSQSNSADEVL
jgi:hypothetical protein